MRLLENILIWTIYSNIFVAICILGLTISSEILFGTSNYKLSQFVFFATLFTYNFQRIFRLRKIQNQSREDWLNKNKLAVFILIAIGAIMSIYHFFDLKTKTQIVIVISGALSVLYPFGLRKIPFSKIFIISLVWTISSMFLLVLENDIPIDSNVGSHLIGRFLFVFAIAIPFDIRDLKFDDKKLKTIPIIFGQSKAKLLAVLSLLIAEGLYIIQYFEKQIFSQHLIGIIISFLITSFFIIKSSEKKSDFYYSFWVESMSLLLYLILGFSTLML